MERKKSAYVEMKCNFEQRFQLYYKSMIYKYQQSKLLKDKLNLNNAAHV